MLTVSIKTGLSQFQNEEDCTAAQHSAAVLETRVESLQETVDSLRQELANARTEASKYHNLYLSTQQELKQKDLTLVSLNAQIEERIKENCSLNRRMEEQANDLAKLTQSLQNRERELKILVAENNQKIQDLQMRVREITNLREDEGHQYEKQIRQLQMELDQLRVRNETFQRQLAAITSTYNLMFPATDVSDVSP